jgi:hypothetical protein
MENFYTAYRKTIDGVSFYFVKKYQTFPEYKDVASILSNYGMHTDFKKACKIAMITDKKLQEQLLGTLENNAAQTKVIKLNLGKAVTRSHRPWQISFPAVSRLMSAR